MKENFAYKILERMFIMKKKLIMACVTILALSLVGCAKEATTEEATVISEETTTTNEPEESTTEENITEENTEVSSDSELVLGKVTVIEGDTITVALGEMKLGEAPSGKKPEGEGPSGDKLEMPFEASGEEVTITIDDSVTIEVQQASGSAEGSIDDISEGLIVSLLYDTDGNVITLQVINGGGQPPEGEAPAKMKTESAVEQTTEETTTKE